MPLNKEERKIFYTGKYEPNKEKRGDFKDNNLF